MDNPELLAQLSALDLELEEGDITHKGYEKRRTRLLAQFGITDSAPTTATAPTTPQPPHPHLRQGEGPSPVSSHRHPTTASSTMTSATLVPLPRVTDAGAETAGGGGTMGAGVVGAGGAGGGGAWAAGTPADAGSGPGYLQSVPPPSIHLRSNSNGSTRDDSLSLPIHGSHMRNFSSGSSQQGLPPPHIEYDHYDDGGPSASARGSRSNTMNDPGNYFSDFTTQEFDLSRDSMQLRRPESNYSQHQQHQQQQQQQHQQQHQQQQHQHQHQQHQHQHQQHQHQLQHHQLQHQLQLHPQLHPQRHPQPHPVHRYSAGDSSQFSPSAAVPSPPQPMPFVANPLLPLEPREVPFAVHDAHNPGDCMDRFDNIASVLRHRARTVPKQQAYVVLDNRGKEMAVCSWEKLSLRAEKVAQVIREKSGLYHGDRVALVYRDVELIDFAVALLGCFIAGVVAVPINDMADHAKLNYILTTTQAHLALTTDSNLKAFQRELTASKLAWPRAVEWWKTNEFGSFRTGKHRGDGDDDDDVPPLQVPDLAYIEFSRAPTGDLQGVVLSHRTIMHQMATLSAIIATAPTGSNSSSTTQTTTTTTQSATQFATQSAAATATTTAAAAAASSSSIGTINAAQTQARVQAQAEVLLSYLDPRHGVGLIQSVLMTVYAGQMAVWCTQATTTTPGLYANIITRYRATLCLADYPALKLVAYNYQTEPFATRNFQKRTTVDFSSVKLMMIDSLTVDTEFHEILADRWLKPLGNPRARDAVAPVLCLPEHGGMVISMHDWIGRVDRLRCPLASPPKPPPPLEPDEPSSDGGSAVESPVDLPIQSSLLNGASSLLSGPSKESKVASATPAAAAAASASASATATDVNEVLLDREALKTNDVVVVAVGDEVAKRADDPSVLRVGAFGYPLPDATLAIVDPESSLLCVANVIGEIWVDSPSLSGGYWNMPRQTESIFHARPYRYQPDDPNNPVAVEPEFLRTGLLGCVIEGKIFVLGLYEDRLRQRVEWEDDLSDCAAAPAAQAAPQASRREEYRYFFVQHLVLTIMRKMTKIYDCSAFDVSVNEEHLPIVLLESQAASTAPTQTGGAAKQLDIGLLDSLSRGCIDILLAEHQLRVYCVMITAPNSLPRVFKNGRREIGNRLCRKEFDAGTLDCVHVEFGVERAVRNLPIGIDPVGGVWSPMATQARQELLAHQDKQYSGVDYRVVVIDDRTSTPLNNFTSIVDLLQWRVNRQAEELAYCSIDGRAREGKGVTWKKLDLKIAAVAAQMKNKWKLRAGDHAVLMYTHSEDFLYALHACFCLGVIAIPLAPLDQKRLHEDVPALLHIVMDFNVSVFLVNAEVDQLLKTKPLSTTLKTSAGVLNLRIPPIHSTVKPPKTSAGCRDHNFTVNEQWVRPSWVAMVWTYWTADQRRVSVALGHDTIMGICKVMKETCQMASSKPVIGCVRSTSGMGFVMSWLMGIFVGMYSPKHIRTTF